MTYLFLLVLLMVSPFLWAQTDLTAALEKCVPSNQLAQQVKNEIKLRQDLQRPNLGMRFVTGYSNNEISDSNPERLQYGVNLRWDDLFDSTRRQEYHEQTGEFKTFESKLQLENFWRHKLQDVYFYKWGMPLKNFAEAAQRFSMQKIAAGSGSLHSLATSRAYTDLLELHRITSDFVGKLQALEKEFSNCRELTARKPSLDFTHEEVLSYSQRPSSRLMFQKAHCEHQKKIRSINNAREAGQWSLAFNTSVTRNQLLQKDNDQFNDIRAGLELNIPITGIKSQEVIVDTCDYQTRQAQSEDLSERNYSVAAYPVLSNLVKQFNDLNARARSLLEGKEIKGAPVSDVVMLSLNLFHLHRTLADGETRMNARIIPAKIVENAF